MIRGTRVQIPARYLKNHKTRMYDTPNPFNKSLNIIICFSHQKKRFPLSEEQQMTVERGDLLGVHYPSGQSDGVLSVNDLEAEPTTAQNRATTGTLRYR